MVASREEISLFFWGGHYWALMATFIVMTLSACGVDLDIWRCFCAEVYL